MALELRGVHVFEKAPGADHATLKSVRPVLRLSSRDNGEVFIQGGRYWTAGGEAIKSKDLPAWVGDEIKKCSPAALAECGIHVKLVETESPTEPQATSKEVE
jgi:hypothetical protein